MVGAYRRALEDLASSARDAGPAREVRELEDEIDLDYLLGNVPPSLDRCFDGIARIATIVRAMKEFGHTDQREKSPADLNRALTSTLTIARNEYKYVADVETDLHQLPPVSCLIGELNQVFLNLIVNAAHAISERMGASGERGRISVRTRHEGQHVRIDVADTGAGIPEAIRERIFEPFFTTKPVGRGTGQGLAIARSIVVDKHGGSLSFQSEVGRGTTFSVRLPVDGAPNPATKEESPR
jgi:two-component system, NtrC family, sensor kinase